MAKEVKLGLTAIGILLAVFCSVLVIKLRRPTDTPPAADIAQALGESREPEQPKLASGPSKLTILSPNDKPESTPRGDSATGDSAADDSAANDGGPQFSTDRYARHRAAGDCRSEAKRASDRRGHRSCRNPPGQEQRTRRPLCRAGPLSAPAEGRR